MKQRDESFSDLLDRILTEFHVQQNNFDLLMHEVFGSGKTLFNDAFLVAFKNIRKEIDQELDDQLKSRYD